MFAVLYLRIAVVVKYSTAFFPDVSELPLVGYKGE